MSSFNFWKKKKTNRIDNGRFYASGINNHGNTPQGLRWHSKHSQEVRFDQLLSLLPHDAQSIVDAGCGFGDLYGYLRSQGWRSLDYVGLDSLQIMVDEALRRTQVPIYHCDILLDPLPESEFYLCSGALNILTHDAAFLFIERCFRVSSRGMIFNFLEGNDKSKTFNYLLKSEIERLGEKLGARVVFRRDYYESDCTAAFYK